MRPLVRFLSSLRGGRLLVAIFLALALLLLLGRALGAAYIEILWQEQAGYTSAFWTRMLWQGGIRAASGALVALLVYLNLKVASATLGGIHIRRRFGNIEISEQIPQAYVSLGMWTAAVTLGLWFAAAIPGNLGIQLLTLVHASPWGAIDPVLHHDLGFYVFWLPVLSSGLTFALVVTFLIFTLATAGYAATGALRWMRGRVEAQELARLHLGALMAVFLVFLAGRLWLGRYLLLLDGNSGVQGIFGYADAEARLPALQTETIICVGAAAGVFWGTWKNRLAPLVGSLAAVLVGTIVIGQIYPSLIQSFRVEPNELERETRHIENNLAFTRLGFGLEDLDSEVFRFDAAEPVDWGTAVRQFSGLPVWSRAGLLTTYRQLEARFPYYDFAEVTFDRYPSPAGPVLVAVSVRQVEPEGIQDPNWQNRHLREIYVEGVGAVVSRATSTTPEGRPEMLLSGIPPQVSKDDHAPQLWLDRPQVFFGTRSQVYAIVDPEGGRFLAADSTEGVPGVDYPQGILLSSPLRTAVLAWQFRDANLVFTSEVTEKSRFVHRRRVVERVRALAPFLRFPETAYPVIAGGRIVWILEGFTGTRAFPLASPHEFGPAETQLSYVRSSVKATVDAVTGRVDFYRVPIDDPLADAYEAAFPGLFKPIAQMPQSLREHLRYSQELLDLQARVLLQYHQETAPAFHGQRDVWDRPQELEQGSSPVPHRPEYGLYALPGDEAPAFYLTASFVPAGRQNLTGILAARTDESGVGTLRLFDVPLADRVPGPRQVEALVEQDPLISQQFSLWRTGGSAVWTGHLHLVPVGKRLLYMEPVFLAAEADAIPELRRFVVSDGNRVVMTQTLPDAVSQLAGLAPMADAEETGGSPPMTEGWPTAALRILERADAAAREGRWQDFGEALEELRAFLKTLENGGS